MSKHKRGLPKGLSGIGVGGRPRHAAASPPKERDEKLLNAVQALQNGRVAEAEALCGQLLEREPHFAPALQLTGMIASRAGKTARAMAILRRVVALDEKSVEARNELGSLLRADKKYGEAISIFQEVLWLRANDAGAHNNLGLCYLAIRQLSEATACFERASSLDPNIVAFHANLAMALQSQGRLAESVGAYRRALELAPDAVDTRMRLGHILHSRGEGDEARAHFHRLIEMQIGLETQIQLATILLEVNELALAERVLRAALKVNPVSAEAYQMLGSVLQQLGRFDKAIGTYESLIAIRPRHGGAYLGIVSVKTITEQDRPLIDHMTSLLRERDLAERDRASLHYALGKALDELGEYERAIGHFDAANRIASKRLRASGHMIDRTTHTANISRLISIFTSEFFNRNGAVGSDSELPVLIVGMIRSGTTLLERILSSHPKIGGGGELRFWGEKGAVLRDIANGISGKFSAASVAEDYCRLLRRIAPNADRITDKMPLNFLMLGLIHLVFPRARIIHCRRNAVDTCLSIYSTPYTNLPDFAHDRGNIAFYYNEYRRLMAHWRLVLPADRFLEIDYEALVASPEPLTRRILSFCGLDWDEACLRHDKNPNAVATPSLWQVRQPIYKNAVERWRNYEAWLGDFRCLLAPS